MFKFIIFFLASISIFAQGIIDPTTENVLEDTTFVPPILNKFMYKFVKGDTLIYEVITKDSIIIEYGKPLLKDRIDFVRIVCDSVDKNRNYYLKYSLIKTKSDEFMKGEEAIKRETSPYLNQVVNFIIDSAGNRKHTFRKESSYAMGPGGAFQPHLLITFKESFKVENESWIVKTQDTLVENGTPYPILNQSTLFRTFPARDTLGHTCIPIDYVRTATGLVTTVTNDLKVMVQSIINGGGTIFIDKKDFIPVVFLATQEQKLKITTPNNEEIPGRHYTTIVYELNQFIPGRDRGKIGDPKSNDIKKIRKKKR